jgi:hypothetical protein
MGVQFNVMFEDQTVGAATTLIIVRPAASAGLRLLRAWASQHGSATSAQCRINIGTKIAAFPTVTGSVPRILDERITGMAGTLPFSSGTDCSAGKCGGMTGTEGAGTFTPLIVDSFNNLTGFLWTPVFEELVLPAGSSAALCMRAPAAWTPSGANSWDIGMTLEVM